MLVVLISALSAACATVPLWFKTRSLSVCKQSQGRLALPHVDFITVHGITPWAACCMLALLQTLHSHILQNSAEA